MSKSRSSLFRLAALSRLAALFRLAALSCVAAFAVACQSDEQKIVSFMENGDAYVEEEAFKEAVIEYRNVLQLDPNHAAAHYALAKAYLELKRGKEAYWELSETVRLDGDNVDARLTLGGLSLIAQNFDEALEQAESAVALDPTKSSGFILYGQALEQLDRAEEAEAQYLKAIETEPTNGPYLLVTAGYYVRQKEPRKAEPLLNKFTEIDPGFLSYSSLGRFLAEDRNRSEEATRAFKKAIELAEPENKAPAIQNLANYYNALQRGDESIALLEASIDQVEPESDGKLDLIYLLARFYRAKGDEVRADELIESATSAQPNSAKPHLILSAYRGRNGDLEGALEAAEAALVVDPEDTKARLRKAELLVDMGYRANDTARIDAGRAIVDDVIEKEPTSPDGLFVRGKVELAQGNIEAAVQALRAAIDSRPEWAQAHFVLGSALTLTGETAEARGAVARAVELDPGMLEARRMLAKLHASLGEHEYAVEHGRVYLAAHPEDVRTRVLVAQSLVRIGRRDDAMKELDSVPKELENAEVLFAKARLSLGMGKPGPGRKLLLRAAKETPHHPEILSTLLALDREQGNIDEASAMIEAAVEAKPENAEIVRLRGALAILKRDAPTAEKSFQRAIELDPDNMGAYQQLAAFYQATGRLDETLETYKRALEKRPNEARLHHFIAVLYEMGGRVDEAIVDYEKAIELDDRLGQAKNNLAYLLAESGKDLDRALDLAQDAKSLMPDSGNAADTLGWVLHKRGVSSAAVGYLKEAVATIDPNSPNLGVVRHHLAQAYEGNDQTQEAIEVLEEALSDLEQRLAAARAKGGKPTPPEWSVAAREMLGRLKPAG